MGTTAFMSVPYALYGEDEDADSNNELQSLSISGDTLFISSGNYIILPAPTLLGCTDSTAINYNASANTDDGSCIAVVLGCTDSTASNYNAAANTDDGSCIAVVLGCTDAAAPNYDPLANTDDGSCIAIGSTYQGGIVFWLDGNGGGLIAAPTDQSSGAQWGCFGTNITGAGGTAIGTGTQNTIDIINANCTFSNGSPTAADICANLTLGGYSDWFLPSKDELNEMYLNKAAIGGFANDYYWSSTEYDSDDAWVQNFSDGYQVPTDKGIYDDVRAVRAFTSNNVLGCTDSTACNYDPLANNDDGS
ncbi:DUF1566 domain-containing protein [Flavobacteriales bacterium]|nr:DUF1566 domain-containing protein [Flavobacteriales bacterium]